MTTAFGQTAGITDRAGTIDGCNDTYPGGCKKNGYYARQGSA
jgi:hypothetical protein